MESLTCAMILPCAHEGETSIDLEEVVAAGFSVLCFNQPVTNCHGMLFFFQVVCSLHHQDVLECHHSQCGSGCGGNAGITGDVLPSTPVIHSSIGMAGWGQILQL